jgi:hypothetical protein
VGDWGLQRQTITLHLKGADLMSASRSGLSRASFWLSAALLGSLPTIRITFSMAPTSSDPRGHTPTAEPGSTPVRVRRGDGAQMPFDAPKVEAGDCPTVTSLGQKARADPPPRSLAIRHEATGFLPLEGGLVARPGRLDRRGQTSCHIPGARRRRPLHARRLIRWVGRPSMAISPDEPREPAGRSASA